MHWPIRHFHPSTTLDISGCNLVPLLLSPNLVHICRVPTLPILATTPYFMWFSKENTISFSQMTESRRSYLRLRETQSFYSRNEEEISGRHTGFPIGEWVEGPHEAGRRRALLGYRRAKLPAIWYSFKILGCNHRK